MQSDRRSFLAGAVGVGVAGLDPSYAFERTVKNGNPGRPDARDLDKAAALPVLKTDGLKSPVQAYKRTSKKLDYSVDADEPGKPRAPKSSSNSHLPERFATCQSDDLRIGGHYIEK